MKQNVRDRIYAQNSVDEWNAANKIGCRVTLRRDNGTFLHTTTRSAAQLSRDNRAVIFVEGVAGYYLLDRVQAE
jgi:ribosomal protein L5